MNNISAPTIGEILNKEFIKLLNISISEVAKETDIPTSIIQDILHDRRKITADASAKLGRLFGISDSYFLKLQNDINSRNIEQ